MVLRCADSSSKCNQWLFEIDLVRRPVAKRLARSVVESLHDVLDLCARDGCEVMPLGEVLPHQPVDLLVEAALP